jgi:guanylate kinase
MAPMGSGKGTLVKHIQGLYPDIHTTVSCTTRDMRPGEIDGKDYYFISSATFDEKITAGDFLEWAHFGLNRYGTLKSEILPRLDRGEIVIAEIELQGVEQLIQLLPRELITIVFIDAGGWETMKRRAEARAPIATDELKKRYERYLVEVKAKDIADIIIDNSGDVDLAKKQIETVFKNVYKNSNYAS